MSDDSENYEQQVEAQQNEQQQEMRYRSLEQIELNKLIHTILSQSQKSQPLFPPLLSKKISETNGLECTENVFFNLMSNIVEYSVNDILINNKELKSTGKYKKQGKDNQLKTLDLQKYFEAKNINIAKPRCYPQIALEKTKGNQNGNINQ